MQKQHNLLLELMFPNLLTIKNKKNHIFEGQFFFDRLFIFSYKIAYLKNIIFKYFQIKMPSELNS